VVRITAEDFSIDEIVRAMKSPEVGAISIYLGTVREFPQGAGLEFKHSESALQKLEQIRNKALLNFDIKDAAIVHRVGFLGISENILLIAVSAVHRQPAFAACHSIIDDIKELHKSWGREVTK
jgi:molybdopterin synthase catalytic subunit